MSVTLKLTLHGVVIRPFASEPVFICFHLFSVSILVGVTIQSAQKRKRPGLDAVLHMPESNSNLGPQRKLI